MSVRHWPAWSAQACKLPRISEEVGPVNQEQVSGKVTLSIHWAIASPASGELVHLPAQCNKDLSSAPLASFIVATTFLSEGRGWLDYAMPCCKKTLDPKFKKQIKWANKGGLLQEELHCAQVLFKTPLNSQLPLCTENKNWFTGVPFTQPRRNTFIACWKVLTPKFCTLNKTAERGVYFKVFSLQIRKLKTMGATSSELLID